MWIALKILADTFAPGGSPHFDPRERARLPERNVRLPARRIYRCCPKHPSCLRVLANSLRVFPDKAKTLV